MYSFNLKAYNKQKTELKGLLYSVRQEQIKALVKEEILQETIDYEETKWTFENDGFENRGYKLTECIDAFQSLADDLDDGYETDIDIEKEGNKIVNVYLTVEIK